MFINLLVEHIMFAPSQIKLPQQSLFIVFTQEPLLHVSVVQEMPSWQSLSTVQLCSEARFNVSTNLLKNEDYGETYP